MPKSDVFCRLFFRKPFFPGRASAPRLPAILFVALAILVAALPGRLFAQAQANVDVTGYVIHLNLHPAAHSMTATAAVTFTAPDTIDTAVFELHNALKVEKVTDAAGDNLVGQRGSGSTIGVALPSPMNKGQSATFTFTYSGTISGGEGSPVTGLQLASIGSPVTYLLYAARWFPMAGYDTDRFTAEIHVQVPADYTVIGSGSLGGPRIVSYPSGQAKEYDFNWTKPGFPGTIIAGEFGQPLAVSGSSNIRVYLLADEKSRGPEYAQTAAKEFTFFSGLFGPPQSSNLNVVELPNGTVPAYWAPEIAAISASQIAASTNYRLLANTMAHQWWGSMISPATMNDAWITNGMCRYGELMYLESVTSESAFQDALKDVSAGALAYDTIPLMFAGRMAPFSPQFQSMTLEKGAMVYHMLRWEIGESAFRTTLQTVLKQYDGKSITSADLEKVAESVSQKNLTPFFMQWLNGTGAPEFTDKYSTYRLGNGSGFRTIGEINQNLDLFNMPVDLRIETQGKTVNRRVDVVGTSSQYVVDTFGMPRRIIIDPDDWILKNSPSMQVRVDILRGQQLAAQGNTTDALAEYQKALKVNPDSSLAQYRIGEVLYTQQTYQAAADAFRAALRGDGIPAWTQVWSYIELGKIFDITGQRDRAVNEYRQAIQTNDNTSGAIIVARRYLETPYKRPTGS